MKNNRSSIDNNKSEDPKSEVVRVVLIEDSRLAAQLVKNQLAKVQGTQFSVEWFEQLATGLDRLEKGGVDVVLLDLNLPDSRGADTFTRTCSQAPQVPIVVLADTDDKTLAAKVMQKGAQDYLVKDQVDKKTLSRAIRHAIERQRLLAELGDKAKETEASKAAFSNIVERNKNGIIIVDQHGIVRYANPAARSLLNLEAEELVGKSFRSPVVAGDTTELEIVAKGGKIFRTEMSVIKTEWEGNLAYLASLHDITQRKLLEEEKHRFFSAVSHDLRSPLNAMKGYLDLILDGAFGKLSGEQVEAMEILGHTNESMTELVNDLLDLEKIRSGRYVLSMEPLDLKDIVCEVSEEFMPLAKAKNLAVSQEFSQDSFPIKSDRRSLRRILSNLVGNAIKFTDQGGIKIVVNSLTGSPDSAKGKVQIRLEDTGHGIEAQNLRKIFDEFYQVEQSGSNTAPGTGLGLAICQRLVGLLQGEISVESWPGRGTRFCVTLPQSAVPAAG
jgi:signal transduction histidine kinase/DNA-binding NarL/FixJ family response regulator